MTNRSRFAITRLIVLPYGVLRLKRMFNIDVSVCQKCGGEARVIACTED